MHNPSSTLVDLETKFWQSMVDHETDVALDLLCEPALMNILAAVIFKEIPGAFSDACNKAITFGKPRLMRDDWLKVFDRDEIAESIRRIT